MNDCLVFEDAAARQKTFFNLKNYNIKNAIFNMALAWEKVKPETIKNCFKKLSNDKLETVEFEMENVEVENFTKILSGDQTEIDNWLEIENMDPCHAIIDDDSDSNDKASTQDNEDEDLELENIGRTVTSSEAFSSLDTVIRYLES